MLPDRKLVTKFLFRFACVFAVLSLPLPGLAWAFSQSTSWLGDQLVSEARFVSGARLDFTPASGDRAAAGGKMEAKKVDPWQAILWVHDGTRPRPIGVPIDVRGLYYLPIAAFVALVLATPVPMARRLRALAMGLLVLLPLGLALIALPLFSFLGGIGPIRVYELSSTSHSLINVVYRALVAPPGMAYAIPALLWWVLLYVTRDSSAVVSADFSVPARQ
jgi:hypothetical protein